MGFQKNFVIKNGLEVNDNLIFADKTTNKVGIGTTIVTKKFEVRGGVGVDNIIVSGIATVSDTLHIESYLKAGNSTGITGDYLINTGAGITWANYTFTAFRNKLITTATAGQTGFTTAYAIGMLDVFVNGVKLAESEYTASDGANITLASPCFGGESVEIFTYTNLNTGIGSTSTTIWINSGSLQQWVTVSSGIYTGVNVGLGTTNPKYKLHVVGIGSTALFVDGNARITGILTVGSSSVTIDGNNNTIGIGTSVFINGNLGIISATKFIGDGSSLNSVTSVYASTSGIATYATSSGIATYAVSSGIATYATSSGIATYAVSSGIATYATSSGVSTSVVGGIGSITQLRVSGISTFINGPLLIGTATSTGTSGQILQVAGVSSSVYIGGNLGIGTTNSTTNLQVVGNTLISGVVTATTFVGNLTGTASLAGYATTAGVSTSVIGGIGSVTQLQVTGVSTFTNGPVFIGTATSTGTASQPLQVVGNTYISGNLGIGTTNPQVKLDIIGGDRFGGIFQRVSTATTYLSGSILVLELDCQQSTTQTYTIPTGANIGIVSFKNMLSQTGVPNITTINTILTQNAAGTGNTTANTGIGTNIRIVGLENGSPVTSGITTRALVGSGTSITLSSVGGDVDFVSFNILYNGGSNISTSSYRVYATRTGSFR